MPAERSKAAKRGADVPQLVWTIPVEPTMMETDGSVSFSSNISSPMLFEDGPPPLVDRPDYLLFPPTGDLSSPRKPHSKKKPEDHIPRPPNAFILFRSSFIKSQHVSTEVETNHSTLSKIIGLTWKNLPNDERLLWHAKAKEALDEHKRKFPQYAFRPTQSRHKGSVEKRKVREVEPKDHKRCAKIAELLVEGKKGQELDAAIQEFDKHHVPEMVTRFEAPLTARMYRRRSSSVPASSGADIFKRRKSRSTSAQPATPVVSNASSISLPEMKTESQPAEIFTPMFDSYPVTPISPSFEFNTFSFDSQPSPIHSFEVCDPLSPISQPSSPGNLLFDTTSSGLSIDTSFCGFDDWNCPSPLSDTSMPTTPSFTSSPVSDAYDPYFPQSFEDSLERSFSSQFPAYSNACNSQVLGAFEPDLTYSDCSHIHMASQDHDFSAFMASLPEYGM